MSSKKINGEVQHIAFSPNGEYVAASSSNGRVWLGEYPSMNQVRSWQAHSKGHTVISFHPSEKYLASGGKDKKIRVWSIPACLKIAEWEAHKLPLSSIAFSPSGEQLASGSQNELLRGGDDTKIWSFVSQSQSFYSKTENPQVLVQDRIYYCRFHPM